MRGTIKERFWAKVDKRGPADCWPWKPSEWRDDYGRFYVGDGRTAPAHVVALEWKLRRRLRRGKRGLHACDYRPCCNPAHLFEGTQKDNIRDMIAKGRGNLQNGAQRGEKNPRSKITRAQAKEIRAITGVRQADIGKRYGLTQGVISKIVRRDIWR